MLKASQILTALVEEGTFLGAARRLGVTQPYLSQCVRRFEERCSSPVIDRNAKPLVLTKVGQVFLDSRIQIEDIEARTQAYCNDVAGLKAGSVSVACNGERTIAVLAGSMAKFHRLYPGISLDLSREMPLDLIPAALSQGLADVGVSYEHWITGDLNALPICPERYLLAAPACVESFGVPYNAAGDYPVIEETDCSQLAGFGLIQTMSHNERLAILNSKLPVRLHEVPIQVRHLATRLALVAEGVGVAICQEHLIASNECKSRCRFASLERILPTKNLVIAWNDRRYRSAAAAEFCRMVNESWKDTRKPRAPR